MRILSRSTLGLAILATLGVLTPCAHAGLVVGDFLSIGDQLLVSDTATNLEWLKPLYTAGETFDDAAVQAIRTNYGFRYATEPEVLSMINSNFGNPPTSQSAAGYAPATAFMALFGVNQNGNCGAPPLPCPRTQGLTSTPSVLANRHDGVGMITIGSDGWLIQGNQWPDTFADGQMGSWLVREAGSSTPEPGTWALCGLGAGLLALARRRVAG